MSDRKKPELHSQTRRRVVQGLASLPLLSLSGLSMAKAYPTAKVNTTGLAVTDKEVTVGQLHSATGTMAISETGSIQAERLAIEQINEMGGILGRQIKIIQEDGASDWPTFAEKAKKLLVNDKVPSVFGCWTSASRKAVLPVFERQNGLLYYPTFYFCIETATTVIYTGQEANAVGVCEHLDDAGCSFAPRRVEMGDACVRVDGARDDRVCHAGEDDVGDVAPASGDEARVLLAQQ